MWLATLHFTSCGMYYNNNEHPPPGNTTWNKCRHGTGSVVVCTSKQHSYFFLVLVTEPNWDFLCDKCWQWTGSVVVCISKRHSYFPTAGYWALLGFPFWDPMMLACASVHMFWLPQWKALRAASEVTGAWLIIIEPPISFMVFFFTWHRLWWVTSEEVRQGQKVIIKWSHAYTILMDIKPEAFSPLYLQAFIVVINHLDPPDNMLTNNALYPWGTRIGKDKPLCCS